MGLLIRMALGESVGQQETVISSALRERCAVLDFFDFAPGKVAEIVGLNFLKEHPNILDYSFNFNVGDTITQPEDDSKRVGYYIAYASNSKELDHLRDTIKEKVYLRYC